MGGEHPVAFMPPERMGLGGILGCHVPDCLVEVEGPESPVGNVEGCHRIQGVFGGAVMLMSHGFNLSRFCGDASLSVRSLPDPTLVIVSWSPDGEVPGCGSTPKPLPIPPTGLSPGDGGTFISCHPESHGTHSICPPGVHHHNNTKIALAVAAARNPGFSAFQESLTVRSQGNDIPVEEIADHHGGRLHYFDTPQPSTVTVEYSATIRGRATAEVPAPVDLIRYVRPSRYAESDRLLPTAYAEFGSLQGAELLNAVRAWVNTELRYVSRSSRDTDGAVETLLNRRGVCRDYAHLAIALLRSKDIPARLAAVLCPRTVADGLPCGGGSFRRRRLACD